MSGIIAELEWPILIEHSVHLEFTSPHYAYLSEKRNCNRDKVERKIQKPSSSNVFVNLWLLISFL